MNPSNAESFPAGLAVSVTYLEPANAIVHGIVLELKGNTMQMRLLTPIPPAQLVKVETQDTLWLGGVTSCRPDCAGYLVEVKLAHALYHLSDLERLARALAMPGNAEYVTEERRDTQVAVRRAQ